MLLGDNSCIYEWLLPVVFSHILSWLDSFQREKRKVREQCENIRRNSSSSRRVSQLQNGEVVEAVTLFEVVSMGKRAMQVFPLRGVGGGKMDKQWSFQLFILRSIEILFCSGIGGEETCLIGKLL